MTEEPPDEAVRNAVRGGLIALGGMVFLIGLGLVMVLVLLANVVPAILRGVFGPYDGNDIARHQVEVAADELRDSLGYWAEATDAETLAVQRFTSGSPDHGVQVIPLAWDGVVDSGAVATIDVRIRARVGAVTSTQIFGRSHSAGESERCYRFTVPLYDDVRRDDFACPTPAPAPLPTPSIDAELPADVEARLSAVLAGADARSLEDAVATAFPETELDIDTLATEDGELVAAVGIPLERECIVMVRHADDTVERVYFDRIQLEPGELGCDVRLYTSPAL